MGRRHNEWPPGSSKAVIARAVLDRTAGSASFVVEAADRVRKSIFEDMRPDADDLAIVLVHILAEGLPAPGPVADEVPKREKKPEVKIQRPEGRPARSAFGDRIREEHDDDSDRTVVRSRLGVDTDAVSDAMGVRRYRPKKR